MKSLITVFILIIPGLVMSQNTDYNKVILPENIKPSSFEEKLVQLAWKNNPEGKILSHNSLMLSKQKKLAKWKWLNTINATGNLNEFTLNPSADQFDRASFYPKYNIGLNISLGTLFLTPLEAGAANERLVMGNLEIDQQKLSTRSDVLQAFELLKKNYKVLKLRSRLKEDFLLLYRESEKKFSLGEIKIDEYRQSSQAFYTRTEAEITAQSDFNRSKFELEELVGLALEDIQGYSEFLNGLNEEIKLD